MNTETPFIITEVKDNEVIEILIKNNLSGELVSIIPEYGARLKELWLKNKAGIVSVLRNIKHINTNNRDALFNNAKLSPFAGRIKNGKYRFNNVIYTLPINFPEEENACHGFIFNKKFKVVNKIIEKDYAACILEYFYDYELDGYPFSYLINIEYKLTISEGLIIKTKITNCSSLTIPISDGWHFYFDLGEDTDELKLKIDAANKIEFDRFGIPSGNVKAFDDFITPNKIGIREFDSCFQVNDKDRIVTNIISEKSNTNVKVWQYAGLNKYNYLIVYTPQDRKSIAIEPITSNINSFNNREGLILLKPEEECILECGIELV
jgi:aldose 1-epimerase